MSSMLLRPTLWILPALAAAIIACGGDKAPTQPAAPASKLAFTVPPTNAAGAQLITPPVQVTVQDASGNTVTSATDAVTLALGANPGAGTLSGTLTVAAVQGIATFNNLRIDRPGSGYTLAASAGGLSGATSAPFAVTLTFATVSAGIRHTCGLTVTGAAYCWGENIVGQLGDGTTTDRLTPVLLSGDVTFASVSASGQFTCGVTAAGAAYCWGANFGGQLGDGTTTSRSTPGLVAGGVTFAVVDAGWSHTCGLTAAGAAYCWGENFLGQLGDGTTTDRLTPVLLVGGVSFTAVRAGDYHTCGVTAAGAAYCWGNNSDGELGDETTTSRSTPGLVAGGVSFATVSAAGQDHTCGLTTAGSVYCWGYNGFGELGDGTTTSRTSPVLVVGGVTFAAVSARGGVYTCGVTAAGAAYCWGDNGDGKLGDGTTTSRTSPVLVSGGVTFAAVRANEYHTCGVTAAGAAYCWGQNGSGQLGDGTTINRLTPVRVVQ